MTSQGVATKEELELIRDTCLLPFMLQMLENDRYNLEHGYDIKLKDILYISIDTMHQWIHDDLKRAKRLLKSAKIKVSEPVSSPDGIRCTAWVRGYEQQFCFWRELAKSEIKIRFGRYVGQIINKHPAH